MTRLCFKDGFAVRVNPETIRRSPTWKQTFIIDRYGNREFDPDPAKTTTLGSCAAAVCNPDINAQNNNRFSSG